MQRHQVSHHAVIGAVLFPALLTMLLGCPGGAFDPNSIFDPNTTGHSLSTRAVGGGEIAVGGDAPDQHGFYADGAQVTLTADPDTDSGFTFSHWEGDASGTSQSVTITMNSDKVVYAIFLATYELNVGVIGNGQAAPSQGSYSDGDVVVLTAVADAGWEFVRWEGSGVNGETSTTVELTMDGNKNITAIFDPVGDAYTLTVAIQGQGGVAPVGGTYPAGQQVTLVATPESGWAFQRWDGDSLSLVSTITITMGPRQICDGRLH